MSLSTRGPWTTSLIGNLPSASVAVSQLRYPSEGRTYYDKKIAEGKTSKEALRALKRRISDVVYRRLIAHARQHQQPNK